MIYDHMTDAELIDAASAYPPGLMRALAERLEIRTEQQSVFQEQQAFMHACDQTTQHENLKQAAMYRHLIDEEMDELVAAEAGDKTVEEFDAVLDLIVVLIGYGLSRGWPMDAGWAEVMRSNMAKIDYRTGKVRKREDGKVLKPEGWTPPDLQRVLEESQHDLF